MQRLSNGVYEVIVWPRPGLVGTCTLSLSLSFLTHFLSPSVLVLIKHTCTLAPLPHPGPSLPFCEPAYRNKPLLCPSGGCDITPRAAPVTRVIESRPQIRWRFAVCLTGGHCGRRPALLPFQSRTDALLTQESVLSATCSC